MTAQDVIEQIKALSPGEQAVVADFLRAIETPTSSGGAVSFVDDATFEAAKARVFAKHAELLSQLAK